MYRWLDNVLQIIIKGPEKLEDDFKALMKLVTNNKFCTTCLWNMKPLVRFPCGHGICARCAWKFSASKSAFETIKTYMSCPACEAPVNITIRLPPLQAGMRVGTLDGGGVFGIVSLCSFRELLKGLPSSLRPCHYFDYIAGESVGMLIPKWLDGNLLTRCRSRGPKRLPNCKAVEHTQS